MPRQGFIGERRSAPATPLCLRIILNWADAYYCRIGRWPTTKAGPIPENPSDTWRRIDNALRRGARGLPGGSSLARLLTAERGARNSQRLPPLTLEQILSWADAHHRRIGRWPSAFASGKVREAPGEDWNVINQCLQRGLRGLRGGDTLSRLLLRKRGVRRIIYRPTLTEAQILMWADAHHRRTGAWPMAHSGAVADVRGEDWMNIHNALLAGRRGLPGGSSLAQLLHEQRGVRNKGCLPPYTIEGILAWADAHHRRTGAWPHKKSGPIRDAPGETWGAVNDAMHAGNRGFAPASGSLHGLLLAQGRIQPPPPSTRRRYKPGTYKGPMGHPKRRPGAPRWLLSEPLRIEQILGWMDAHRHRTGKWPTADAGRIYEYPQLTWKALNLDLARGMRGLPGGSSVAQLLAEHRGRRNRGRLPDFTAQRVLAWADAHFRSTGAWPRYDSGPVLAAPGETWAAIEKALQNGRRGFAGPATTLSRFLGTHGRHAERRAPRPHRADGAFARFRPRLTINKILTWGKAHRLRTGQWPGTTSGPVLAARGEWWSAIDKALRQGQRGLPGGMSLRGLWPE